LLPAKLPSHYQAAQMSPDFASFFFCLNALAQLRWWRAALAYRYGQRQISTEKILTQFFFAAVIEPFNGKSRKKWVLCTKLFF
jgi:hypothetical protein